MALRKIRYTAHGRKKNKELDECWKAWDRMARQVNKTERQAHMSDFEYFAHGYFRGLKNAKAKRAKADRGCDVREE